jgi:diguanylate cyclase (GGDEF)-like protein
MAIIAVAAIVAAGVLGIFLHSAGQKRNEYSRAVDQDTLEISLLQDARAAAVTEANNFTRYAGLGREQSLGIALRSRSEVDLALERARTQALDANPDGVGAIEALLDAHRRLSLSYNEVIQLVQGGNVDEANALGVALGLDSRSTGFLDDLSGMITRQRTERDAAQAAYQEAETASDQTTFTIVAVWSSFIVAGMILTFRWIVRPLERIGSVAQSVATGDRSRRASQDGPAEIAALGASVNQMTNVLVDHSRRLERALAAEKERARRDPVTGALNHGAIVEEVKARLARGASPFAVIMADVDGLKETNDVHGHPMGDRVLIAVAAALSQKPAIVGRYGGDEFVALLAHANYRDATEYVESVRCEMDKAYLAAEGNVRVSVEASLGIAMYPMDATSVEGLMRVSDLSMYRTKRKSLEEPQERTPDADAA